MERWHLRRHDLVHRYGSFVRGRKQGRANPLADLPISDLAALGEGRIIARSCYSRQAMFTTLVSTESWPRTSTIRAGSSSTAGTICTARAGPDRVSAVAHPRRPVHAYGRGPRGPGHGTNGRHPLPDPVRLRSAKLGAAGVGADTQVVAYDAQGCVNAARLWWMLRWLGHDAVAVLDGGLIKWQREEHPVTAALPPVMPARFEARLATARRRCRLSCLRISRTGR